MKTVNIHEAKTHLSRLLKRVGRGEEIVIAHAGTPVARLVPLAVPPAPRTLGGFEREVRMKADFDAPLPRKLQTLFDGDDDAAPA
jgi:prevent-host-death family protein